MMNEKMTNCKTCNAPIAKDSKVCPQCGATNKKSLFKKWWFWVIVAALLIGIVGANSGENKTSEPQTSTVEQPEKPQVNDDGENHAVTTEKEDDVPTEYKSALKKAKSYSDNLHMSKQGIYDQLTSEYGEKFSVEAAQYAMDHLEVDWKENALKKAQSYQETMSMSPNAIYDQLISEYGEKFTPEEADYAIAHLE